MHSFGLLECSLTHFALLHMRKIIGTYNICTYILCMSQKDIRTREEILVFLIYLDIVSMKLSQNSDHSYYSEFTIYHYCSGVL